MFWKSSDTDRDPNYPDAGAGIIVLSNFMQVWM